MTTSEVAKVTFRAKLRTLPNGEQCLHVPRLERKHCDMASFSRHPRYGRLVRYDEVLDNLLDGIAFRYSEPGLVIRPSHPPAGVTVDTSKTLAVVTIEVR